jgi:cell wall-associated NlpC family hydrolase
MTTVTRAQFVAEARTWVGTPYRHQGRLKGIACDCVGLVLCTAKALGLTDIEYLNYDKRPDGTLRTHCETNMEPIPRAKLGDGDVLLFHWSRNPMHLAIVTDAAAGVIVHAYLPNRRVVEHRTDEKWWTQVAACYHVPGVTD